jgi:cytochrome P450
VYAEVRGRLQGRAPTAEDLPHLPLLLAVFEESMRLYPPFPSQTRVPGESDTVQGYAVTARTPVLLCQWITHRHPDFWDRPDEFRPERFLPPNGPSHKFAYFPFGGGPFTCLGKTLAMMEGQLVIATVLQARRIELLGSPAGATDTTISIQPQGGMMVRLTPR